MVREGLILDGERGVKEEVREGLILDGERGVNIVWWERG